MSKFKVNVKTATNMNSNGEFSYSYDRELYRDGDRVSSASAGQGDVYNNREDAEKAIADYHSQCAYKSDECFIRKIDE